MSPLGRLDQSKQLSKLLRTFVRLTIDRWLLQLFAFGSSLGFLVQEGRVKYRVPASHDSLYGKADLVMTAQLLCRCTS